MRAFVYLCTLSVIFTALLSVFGARSHAESLATPPAVSHPSEPNAPAKHERKVAAKSTVSEIGASPGSTAHLQGLVLAFDGQHLYLRTGNQTEKLMFTGSVPQVGSTVSCLARRESDQSVKCLRLSLILAATRNSVAQTQEWRSANLERLSPEGKALARWIRSYNPRIATDQAQYLAILIHQKSNQYELPVDLLASLIAQESAFNPRAVSPVGAAGLGQLMPETARQLGVRRVFNTEENLDGAARYLRQMLLLNGMRTSLALAAYNAGPGAVANYGGIPPYAETQNYVIHIQRRRVALRNFLDAQAS